MVVLVDGFGLIVVDAMVDSAVGGTGRAARSWQPGKAKDCFALSTERSARPPGCRGLPHDHVPPKSWLNLQVLPKLQGGLGSRRPRPRRGR
jgi:hypothetical protein